MGYYTGNGVVTGGSDDIQVESVIIQNGTGIVFRRDIRSVTVKNGVSLTTAREEVSAINNTSGDVTSGTWHYPCPVRNGTIKRVSYSQISGSNLYQLSIENDEYHHKINNGSWDS